MKIIYTIYQITNLVDGKFYVGMHQTKNLNDGYMGSGKLVSRAIKKYGVENFKKEILWLCSSYEEMKEFEKGVITEEFLEQNKGKIYNLLVGGMGGFYYVNKEGMQGEGFKNNTLQTKVYEKRLNRVKKYFKENRILISNNRKERFRIYYLNHDGFFKGKQHTAETKIKQSVIAKERLKDPTKNSQFGTCWITKDGVNKKIKKEELNSWIEQGWCKGRIIDSSV